MLCCAVQEAERVLELMGRDFDHTDALTAGIVIAEPKLLFVAADAGGTL